MELQRKRRRLVKKFHDKIEKEFHRNINGKKLKMTAGSFYLPKENEDKPLGEDAHFVLNEEQTIGVADGVGGWALKGIDSGIYARELMDNAVCSIEEQPMGGGCVDLKQVLNEAFLNSEAKGSSTACIISLNNNFLHAVSVGDSGFLVIRKGKVVYQSPIQQSRFNCPYQLGNRTSYVLNLAVEIVFEVKPGDVLVAATDGLFDNLFPVEIADTVNLCKKQKNPPDLMAWTLVKFARQRSLNEYLITPFTAAAMDDGRDLEDYRGGKYDDVTVIVGYIS